MARNNNRVTRPVLMRAKRLGDTSSETALVVRRDPNVISTTVRKDGTVVSYELRDGDLYRIVRKDGVMTQAAPANCGSSL